MIVSFDLKKTNFKELKKIIENLDINEELSRSIKKVEIPVCFDETLSLDIKRLEKKLTLSKDKIFENILPTLCLLSEKDKKILFEDLDKLDFNINNLKLD